MKIGQFIDHAVSSVQCDPLIWILISPVAKVVELAASIIIMHIYLGGYNYHNGVVSLLYQSMVSISYQCMVRALLMTVSEVSNYDKAIT